MGIVPVDVIHPDQVLICSTSASTVCFGGSCRGEPGGPVLTCGSSIKRTCNSVRCGSSVANHADIIRLELKVFALGDADTQHGQSNRLHKTWRLFFGELNRRTGKAGPPPLKNRCGCIGTIIVQQYARGQQDRGGNGGAAGGKSQRFFRDHRHIGHRTAGYRALPKNRTAAYRFSIGM